MIGAASARRIGHALAEADDAAGAFAGQGLGVGVVDEVFVAEGGDWDEAVGAGFVELHEEAEAGDAGDCAFELGADAVGEVGGEVAVGGVALGHHRAALGHGDVLAGLGEAFLLGGRQAVVLGIRAPAVGADQRAVDDEVGVAADRRGEVAIGGKGEAEVAEVLRGVVGLGHRAQHAHVDHLGVFGAGHAVEQAVEVGGLEHLALGERQADRLDDLAQGFELFRARFLVDAVEQAQALFLERLGGCDVGEDHELLDDAVGVEALAEGDGQDAALVGEHDPALGEVEVQRLAAVARAAGGAPGGPERGDDGVVAGIGAGLGLGVGEGRLRAHQGAGEAVGAGGTVGVEDEADGDAGAVDAVDERAEVARQAVGEHRDDPVGEVGGVAPAAGLAVERRAGADVGGDVGDGDPDDVAAGVGGIVVGVGEDGVVVVAGVGGVDGDEGEVAQILAVAERRGAGGFGFGQGVFGEGVGDAVLVDGDERDCLRRGGVAEAGDDPGAGQAVASGGAGLLGLDQFAVAGAGAVGGGDLPVAVGLLVDGGDAAAGLAVVVDAEHALGAHADAADHAGGERSVGAFQRRHPAEQAVAGAERGVVAAGEDLDARGRNVGVPLGGLGPEVAVGVGAGDAQHEDGGKRSLRADLAAALFKQAVAGHAREELLELDLGRALEAKGAGDLALAGLGRVVAQEGEDVVGRGEWGHGRLLARARDGRHRKMRGAAGQSGGGAADRRSISARWRCMARKACQSRS